MNIIEQAKSWPHGLSLISDWLGSDAKVVHPETAQARANICLQCPKHDSKSSVTGAMAGVFKRLLEYKSKLGLRVSGEKQLGLCGVCSCACRLKIWQTHDRVCSQSTETELKSYPSNCWILTEKI